ncbi:pentapeptide repeat-containing protein [Hymenobacter gummosus]|uniref:Pentapeptide repeat-containing protein n=1 Tax=Hymenobacter gummosus TaxID=1776032 RepID=A0A431U0S9_9BACT|nr:pentapeptide repeat-containing protein [Hymenobacter gummosus]RTQ48549.1 pentapeptide repeat-containing protein [Hymenobacter gummosus]
MKSRRPTSARPRTLVFPADHVHERWTAAELLMAEAELELQHFVGCDFAGARLDRRRFTDCRFERCNLALASLTGTALQHVTFVGCKLTGLPLAACRDFLLEVQFEDCQLDYASFAGKPLAGTRFERCTLSGADFTGADLTGASFAGCTLDGAVFQQTRLGGADLRTATGLHLDPEQNVLTKARFALDGLPGLLGKYDLVIE